MRCYWYIEYWCDKKQDLVKVGCQTHEDALRKAHSVQKKFGDVRVTIGHR